MSCVPVTAATWDVPILHSVKGMTTLVPAAFPIVHARQIANVTVTLLSCPRERVNCSDHECLLPERQWLLEGSPLCFLSPMRAVIFQFDQSGMCSVGAALISNARAQALWSLGRASYWTWDELLLAQFQPARLVVLVGSTAESTVKFWSVVRTPGHDVVQVGKNIHISGRDKFQLYG